jgi:cell division protein FtsN
MKVICPKCQFENQADSMRVVCARCATIIAVRMDQTSGLDSNGKRQTAGLPFASNSGNSQASNSQPSNSQQLNQPRDVYATRIGEDFDDVLDIPRPAQPNYQTSYESSPVFDDVFATPGYDTTENYDFSTPERKPTVPIDNFQPGMPRQRDTQDYIASAEPEFMGWPVLPENSLEEEEPASGFSAGRGGLLARIVICALVFGGLVFGAYYFLGDLISKRKDQETNLVAGGNQGANQQAGQPGTTAPAPATNPEVKPGDPSQAQNSAATDAPKTATTPIVINPKPSDDKSQAGNTTDKTQVNIPPVPVGRTGQSESPRPAPAPSTPNKGNMTIQVASFNDQAQANDRAARLKSAGVDARVVRAEISGKGTWYRVQIGGFGTREEALSYGNRLKANNTVQDFIVTSIVK